MFDQIFSNSLTCFSVAPRHHESFEKSSFVLKQLKAGEGWETIDLQASKIEDFKKDQEHFDDGLLK